MRILIVLPCDFLIVLTCDLLIFNSFLYHLKQIDCNLQWVCAVIRHDDDKIWAEHQGHNPLRLVFSPHLDVIRYIFTEWTHSRFCIFVINISDLLNFGTTHG